MKDKPLDVKQLIKINKHCWLRELSLDELHQSSCRRVPGTHINQISKHIWIEIFTKNIFEHNQKEQVLLVNRALLR